MQDKRKVQIYTACLALCLLTLSFSAKADFSFNLTNATNNDINWHVTINSTCPTADPPFTHTFSSARQNHTFTIPSVLVYDDPTQFPDPYVSCGVLGVVAIRADIRVGRSEVSCSLQLPPGNTFNLTAEETREGCKITLN